MATLIIPRVNNKEEESVEHSFKPSINCSEINVASRDVDILDYRPSLSPHMYLPTGSDDNDHLPAMPKPMFDTLFLSIIFSC